MMRLNLRKIWCIKHLKCVHKRSHASKCELTIQNKSMTRALWCHTCAGVSVSLMGCPSNRNRICLIVNPWKKQTYYYEFQRRPTTETFTVCISPALWICQSITACQLGRNSSVFMSRAATPLTSFSCWLNEKAEKFPSQRMRVRDAVLLLPANSWAGESLQWD